jgi:hypothetical protein
MTRSLFGENAPPWLCVTAGSRFSTRERKVGGSKPAPEPVAPPAPDPAEAEERAGLSREHPAPDLVIARVVKATKRPPKPRKAAIEVHAARILGGKAAAASRHRAIVLAAPPGYVFAPDAMRGRGYNARSLYASIKAGLPCIYVNGHPYLRPGDLDAFKARVAEWRRARFVGTAEPERREA